MKELKSVDFSFIRFVMRAIYRLEDIILPLIKGEGLKSLTMNVLFILADPPESYNTILVWTTINPNGIVPSTMHQKSKFPTPYEVG